MQNDIKKLICPAACVLCVILILISIIVVSPRAGDVRTYEDINKTLDEKRNAVIEISAVINGLSFVIAAVPGDSTTPISNEISQFNSYLVIALAAIMFEKFMLPLLGLVVFRFILPAAFLFILLYLVFRKKKLMEVGIHLAVLCIALMAAIPLGVKAGSIIDKSFGTEDLIHELKSEMDDIDRLYEEDNRNKDENIADEADQKSDEEAGSFLDGLYNRLTDTVEEVESSIKEAVTRNSEIIIEKSKVIITRTMDVIAVIIAANIILPILVILVMCWALKIAFTNIFLFEPEINVKGLISQNDK